MRLFDYFPLQLTTIFDYHSGLFLAHALRVLIIFLEYECLLLDNAGFVILN